MDPTNRIGGLGGEAEKITGALGREERDRRLYVVSDVHPSSYQTDWSVFKRQKPDLHTSTQACDVCDPVCTNCSNYNRYLPSVPMCIHNIPRRQSKTCTMCDWQTPIVHPIRALNPSAGFVNAGMSSSKASGSSVLGTTNNKHITLAQSNPRSCCLQPFASKRRMTPR